MDVANTPIGDWAHVPAPFRVFDPGRAGAALTKSALFLLAGMIPLLASGVPVAVTDPNGHLTGSVDGNTFDLPVTCAESSDTMLEAASHTDLFWSSNVSTVEFAVRVIRMGGMPGLTAYVDGERCEFGSMGFEFEGFPIEYQGDIRSKKHGNYAARFSLDCPDA